MANNPNASEHFGNLDKRDNTANETMQHIAADIWTPPEHRNKYEPRTTVKPLVALEKDPKSGAIKIPREAKYHSSGPTGELWAPSKDTKLPEDRPAPLPMSDGPSQISPPGILPEVHLDYHGPKFDNRSSWPKPVEQPPEFPGKPHLPSIKFPGLEPDKTGCVDLKRSTSGSVTQDSEPYPTTIDMSQFPLDYKRAHR